MLSFNLCSIKLTSLQNFIMNDLKSIKNKIFIFDGHNLIYKSYFALPKLYDAKNRPTGAIQGTCNILFKFLLKYEGSMFCIASDSGGKNFRHQLFEQYKAHRKEIDPELLEQIIAIQNIYKSFGLCVLGNHGHEADDYIASFVKKFSDQYKIYIISSDKDLTQLVNTNVNIIDPIKEEIIDEIAVENKFGVRPKKINDYLSLIGDASDNIPGISGIGPKTALKILQYGSITESIAQNFDNIKDPKLQKKLRDNLNDLLLSKKLVTMVDNLPINIEPEQMVFNLHRYANDIYQVFLEYDLNNLGQRIEKFIHKKNINLAINSSNSNQTSITQCNEISDEIVKNLYIYGKCSFNITDSNIVQLLIQDKLFNIPIDNCPNQLKIILEDSSIKKIIYQVSPNIKQYFKLHNIQFSGLYILSFLYFNLLGTKANDNFNFLANYCELNLPNSQNEHINLFESLFNLGLQKIFEIKHIEFFENDRKIYDILWKMEQNGILIDCNKLNNLQKYFDDLLDKIKDQAIEKTGYDFNLISPKQTSDILFNKLGIEPVGKKSLKTNLYSTDVTVLEELSLKGFEIADLILNYRSIFKLKTSYCESLPNKTNPLNNKIHTSFLLNGATTGRILSFEPNLQNIPTKTEEGKKIRGCFIASEGHQLVSMDYSQIELRILANLANVQNLKNAFLNNTDIHSLTASEIFGIDLKNVNDFYRSKAKAINFGIIYGISSFGLAKQLKISNSDASLIIKNYFRQYPEIFEYLEQTKKFNNINGYVKTMFNRHCYPPSINQDDLHKTNFHHQQFLERASINAPIQGTASDIIKLAMIQINNFINKNNLNTKILLQIHDELILEVPNEELQIIKKECIPIMENIGKDIKLPLQVSFSYANNWQNL